ncbi:MAG: FAD/NAD(P)-binding protein [Aureliella sp.]
MKPPEMTPNAMAAPTEQLRNDPWTTWSITVKHVIAETPGVFTYAIAFDDPQVAEQYTFQPGQFNMLYLPGAGEAAISIASSRSGSKTLLHTVRSVGNVTRELEAAGCGQSLGLRGPFGTAWPLDELLASTVKQDVIFVAGGIGLAPLRAMIEQLAGMRERFGQISVLIGARTAADILYRGLHDDWRSAEIEVQCTVDRADPEWSGHVGVVTLLLERHSVPRPQSTTILTCGPDVMMRYVANSALTMKIPPHNIWVTLERNMNCAIGLCGHCQMGPLFLCKDGPVLRYDRVKSWLGVHDL